jgi:hypothetical protein
MKIRTIITGATGMVEEEYTRITYDLTLNIARLLVKLNPEMTFCYITGAGTDSSEQGRVAWARVKGVTENALIRLFKQASALRFMVRGGRFEHFKPGFSRRAGACAGFGAQAQGNLCGDFRSDREVNDQLVRRHTARDNASVRRCSGGKKDRTGSKS